MLIVCRVSGAGADAPWSQLELVVVGLGSALTGHYKLTKAPALSDSAVKLLIMFLWKTINPTPTEHSQSPVIGQTVTKQIT